MPSQERSRFARTYVRVQSSLKPRVDRRDAGSVDEGSVDEASVDEDSVEGLTSFGRKS